MKPEPTDRGIMGEGVGIQDAIAAYLLEATDMEIQPLVGNFTLVAEIVDPDSGAVRWIAIQTETLPLWTEYGMLGLRANDVARQWHEQGSG